jgi:hypothetical protein
METFQTGGEIAVMDIGRLKGLLRFGKRGAKPNCVLKMDSRPASLLQLHSDLS